MHLSFNASKKGRFACRQRLEQLGRLVAASTARPAAAAATADARRSTDGCCAYRIAVSVASAVSLSRQHPTAAAGHPEIGGDP